MAQAGNFVLTGNPVRLSQLVFLAKERLCEEQATKATEMTTRCNKKLESFHQLKENLSNQWRGLLGGKKPQFHQVLAVNFFAAFLFAWKGDQPGLRGPGFPRNTSLKLPILHRLANRLENMEGLHSLKLTVRTCHKATPKENYSSNHPFFRCYVSFWEGNKTKCLEKYIWQLIVLPDL